MLFIEILLIGLIIFKIVLIFNFWVCINLIVSKFFSLIIWIFWSKEIL